MNRLTVTRTHAQYTLLIHLDRHARGSYGHIYSQDYSTPWGRMLIAWQ